MPMKSLSFLLFFLLSVQSLFSQTDSISLTERGQFEYWWTFSCYTSLIDRNDSSFVYSASSVLGLVTFDVSDPDQPSPIDTLPPADFNGHSVSSLYQEGDRLFLALGSFQALFASHQPGMAILDVSNPAVPTIEAIWDTSVFDKGSAIIRVQDDYAYLGIMNEGVLILDISNPSAIHAVGHIQPDPTFPPTIPHDPNARGMEVRDSLLYVAYDAGGLRIIDISDKFQPVEINKHMHAALDSVAIPAYNNIRLWGDYAFIAVDYCGLEVVDISDPTDVQSVYWYNPWDCKGTSWIGSPGHSNELVLLEEDSLLFMTGGDTELVVLDIRNPALPVPIAEYGALNDSAVSWGLDVWGDQIVLSLIDNSFGWSGLSPYYGDQGGIRLLEWKRQSPPLAIEPADYGQLKVFPNPAQDQFIIELPEHLRGEAFLEIWRINGEQVLQKQLHLDSNQAAILLEPSLPLSPGPYVLRIRQGDYAYSGKLWKQ